MNAIELAQEAKKRGYVVAVKAGKVQFQTVVYDDKGRSKITRHTDFISVAEAFDIIKDSPVCAS